MIEDVSSIAYLSYSNAPALVGRAGWVGAEQGREICLQVVKFCLQLVEQITLS